MGSANAGMRVRGRRVLSSLALVASTLAAALDPASPSEDTTPVRHVERDAPRRRTLATGDDGVPRRGVPVCVDGRDVDGNECGTVVNGPCADLRDAAEQPELIDPEAHPNGDWSPFHRCGADVASGRPMVCVRRSFPGGAGGICKICGQPGEGSAGDFTMQGCPAAAGGDPRACPAGYTRGTDGRCWAAGGERPDWECQADCGSLYGSAGYCFHSGAWRQWWKENDPQVAEAIQAAKQDGAYYPAAICAERGECRLSGTSCAARGEACSDGRCVAECATNADCDAASGFPLRYPSGFECSAAMTCRLS